jgi:arsenite-transporting ATPase
VLRLPSVLRRCVVTSARVRDGAVRVRFARDPALWPAS